MPASRPGSSPAVDAGPGWRGDLAWSGAVAALAAVCFGLIWLPGFGDHSLYALFGLELDRGRALYTEVWDVKQPGIFLWYAAVQALAGGWSPVLLRALDVLIAVLTAVLVGRLVRPHVSRAVSRWVPMVAAAVVLVPVGTSDLGQVEQLVCLPMTAALVLATTHRPGPVRTLLAGICVGLVAVLKLWIALVPLVAIAVWLLARRRAGAAAPDGDRGPVVARLALVAAGAAVPVAAVLVWLAATGALGAALQTWFLVPQQMLAQSGVRPVGRLVKGIGKYALLMAPVLLLAAARVPTAVRTRDPLDLALLAWVATGLVVIALQLWWPYHWLQLTPAVVALAARGLHDLRERHRVGRVVVLGLVAASVPLLVFGLFRPDRPLVLGNGFTPASRTAIAERMGTEPAARAELAAVGPAPADTLEVFGDPIYNLLLGRPHPIRINTWSPELLTDDQWAEVGSSLAAARPTLILVDHDNTELVATRSAVLADLLAHDYRLVRSSDAGEWYHLGPAA